MGKYRIELKRSAVKELRVLQKHDLQKIMNVIGSLADEPRPPGAKQLCGDEKYRIRWGNFRILYFIQDEVLVVFVVKVGHRRDVYR